MKGITRRQAIGTMGAAAAFATGLGRPVFAETAERLTGRAGPATAMSADWSLSEGMRTSR
jgi:hypothetical protein